MFYYWQPYNLAYVNKVLKIYNETKKINYHTYYRAII